MATYKVGDMVICKFFNTPDGKFYGDEFEAEILQIGNNPSSYRGDMNKTIKIKKADYPFPIWLQRKEVKRRAPKKVDLPSDGVEYQRAVRSEWDDREKQYLK